VIWSHNILSENNLKNLTWGKSCSPLIVDDLVVVTGSDQSAPSLLAYDLKSGALRWKNGADPAGYSSPTLATLAGIKQILVINAESVTGHEIAGGAVLWRHPFPGTWAKASQPIALDGDRLFISAGYGLGCAMLQITAQDSKCSVKELWHKRALRTQFSSAVVRDGFAYGLDDTILVCIDLKTGERKWKDGKYGYGQLLLAGSKLVIQAEAGEVALVEASPDAFHELAKIDALTSRTWSNPALAGEYMLVRNDREVICFKLQKK
jgi:outer membrane protein assembly factor BamB